jgi:hypothetical protein
MPDLNPTTPAAPEKVRSISTEAKAALEKLSTPEAIVVMEELMRAAAGNNNNNNNGGGGGSAASRISRDEMVKRLNASMSDDQLHAILVQHGMV